MKKLKMSKHRAQSTFFGLSVATVSLLWLAIAILGTVVTMIIFLNCVLPNATTNTYWDLAYYPWLAWAGAFTMLFTALWIALGVFASQVFWFGLYDNNTVISFDLEDIRL